MYHHFRSLWTPVQLISKYQAYKIVATSCFLCNTSRMQKHVMISMLELVFLKFPLSGTMETKRMESLRNIKHFVSVKTTVSSMEQPCIIVQGQFWELNIYSSILASEQMSYLWAWIDHLLQYRHWNSKHIWYGDLCATDACLWNNLQEYETL